MNKDAWKRINKTLEILPKLDCRKVLRLTLIKDFNDSNIKEWAKFIKKAGDLMLEIKAYMWIGGSRKRLKKENMPSHEEVIDFSKKLAEELGIKVKDIYAPTGVWADFMPVVQEGFEACWLGSEPGLKYVHTVNDDMNLVSKKGLKMILDLCTTVVRKLENEFN